MVFGPVVLVVCVPRRGGHGAGLCGLKDAHACAIAPQPEESFPGRGRLLLGYSYHPNVGWPPKMVKSRSPHCLQRKASEKMFKPRKLQ